MPDGEVDFEVEYNNRARVADHADHMARWYKDAASYRETALCELDLPYALGERHRLDLFYPPGGDKGGPVVLFFHGGYWQALDKSSTSHLARGANERGLTVAIPNYDLAPAATLDDILRDAGIAAAYVAKRTGRPLLVAGHSAGGHLAACLMGRPPSGLSGTIRGALPISGLFDLVPLVHTSVVRALNLTTADAERLSPIGWLPLRPGNVVAVVGEAESAEYRRQSHTFVARWAEAGINGSVHEVPGAHHFNVLNGLADPESPLSTKLMALSRSN